MDMCAKFQALNNRPEDEAQLETYCKGLRSTLDKLHAATENPPGGKHKYSQLAAG